MQVSLNLKKVFVNRFLDYKSVKKGKSNVFLVVIDLVIRKKLYTCFKLYKFDVLYF